MPGLNTTRASGGQLDAPPNAESVMQQYREQESRLTGRLRLLTVLVVAAAAFIVYAISVGEALHATGAIAGTLVCLGGAAQTRTARNRVRQLLKSGAAETIAHRVAEASRRPADAPPLFSQQYCMVNRQFAGGRLQAGPVPPVFLVVVRDSQLAVMQAPATPVMRVPAADTQISTPKLQRRFGTITTLRIAGQLWGFDFSRVYLAEQHAGSLRQAFTLGSPRKSFRRGREINDRFVAALLESGASR
jgi:hypothetical protein